MGYRDGQGAISSGTPIGAGLRLGRLRIRAKLYLAFSAMSALVIASAIGATIWTSNSDDEILRNLTLADYAERQSTVVELSMITMSDAMRGFLLNPSSEAEVRRKIAADEQLVRVVAELKVSLTQMPSVLRRIVEIGTFDAEFLDKTENELLEMASNDIDAAKRFYETDYLPLRERQTGLILGLREEIERVKDEVRIDAANTRAKQFVFGFTGTAVILVMSGLLAWLSGRAIAGQIRAMTTAMGRLAAGDTSIEIPAQDNTDEIGDMAKAVDVFKQNMIRADELAIERQLIEKQLVQAQKMEAIGNLTGGMAHDFNNLLGVVVLNLDAVQGQLREQDPLRKLVSNALASARSGAALIRGLLAFARRQTLKSTRVDINEQVSSMHSLLSRTLGEDIDIVLACAPDLWPVIADRSQIEACIVNLATNARDAMPNGGRLTITTGNQTLDADFVKLNPSLTLGDYAVIAVSDTGSGMTPEVAAMAFEPFFTTKEVGKGTGLGLSMVFGFANQSGGHVTVESEPGVGTTFRLFLPRARDRIATDVVRPLTATGPERGRGETVLVVEDNVAMREAVVQRLTLLNYLTIETDSAPAALDVLGSEKIDLVFSDVVMPGGMDGFKLAAVVRTRWPNVKMLLTSGFSGDRMNRQLDALKPSPRLLGKPYDLEQLAHAVHETLAA